MHSVPLSGPQLRYGEEVKLLKAKLKELTVSEGVSSQATHPHTTVQALHKELQQKKAIYEARIAEMSAEIKRLKKPRQKQLADVTNRPAEGPACVSAEGRGPEELPQLKREYQQMRRERDTLAREVGKLQSQLDERKAAAYDPSAFESKELEKVTREKNTLEQQVCVGGGGGGGRCMYMIVLSNVEVSHNPPLQLSQWQVVMAQERVQWQSQLAHTETIARQTREQLEEKVCVNFVCANECACVCVCAPATVLGPVTS